MHKIATVPMVGMFDMGLRAAGTSGNYDKARALANEQLEKARSLPYAKVRDVFPGGATTTYDGSGRAEARDQQDPEYDGFEYDIVKQYVELKAPVGAATTSYFEPTGTDKRMVRVTVTVRWGDGDYTTTGVVAG